MTRNSVWALMLFAFSGCSFQGFFYYPNRYLYVDPARTGAAYEPVEFKSLNGRKLTGLYFTSQGETRGVVVHFHGNFANVTNHFPAALFLTHEGFDVLTFDYQGYGTSEGKPSPKALFQDGRAAVQWAEQRAKAKGVKLVVFGQSLGGFTALQVMAVEPGIQAGVIESAFTTHRAMARAVLGRSVWSWPLYPWVPLLTNHRYSALRDISKVAPRPLFLIHGDADRIVPVAMAKTLYAAAGDPKELWIIPGAEHMQCHRKAGEAYRTRIAPFFHQALQK